MTEWKEYKLGEIADILDYKRKPLSSMERSSRKGIYPYYGASGVIDNIDDYIFDGEHVLISEDGENLRTRQTPIAFLANGKFWVNNHAHILKADYVHSRLICYYFAQLDLNPYITGAVQPKLSQDSLNRIPLFLPTSINEREKIVSILSSLDDKIDLLHRENATLEQMAETLFRQWFVVEAKEEWEEGKLGDYVELVNGVSYKGDELQPSNVAMVTLKSFDRNGGFRMDGYKEFTGKFKKEQVLYDGDLVVAHTDITQEADVIGNPVIVIGKNQYETITFSMDVVKVVSKSEFFSNSFLYYLMKTQAFKEHCLGYANGSTVLHLSKKAIPEFEFHIPPKIIAQSFQKQVESINKKILNNNNEIQTLIQMRDGLLPRLMSGEINITEI